MKPNWRSALGILLSVALLVWTLHDVNATQVWGVLRASNVLLLILSSLLGTMIFPLRARRWRVILDPVAPRLPFGMLWRATAIGMMVNNVVPARAGEIARAYALTRETPRVGFSAAFASLAVDRLFDALVVLLLMVGAMFDPAFPGQTTIAGYPITRWAGLSAVAVAGLMAVLYLIVFFPSWIIRLFEIFVRRIAPRLEARGREALLAFAGGLGVLRSPSRFVAVFGWTLLHWLTNALAFYVGFVAVGIHVPYTAAFFLQGLIAIGVAVPASPGFFGVFEALGKAGLAVYGVDVSHAVTWAVGFHILSFIPITVIGAWYFAQLGLHFRELRETTSGSGDTGAPLDGAAGAER